MFIFNQTIRSIPLILSIGLALILPADLSGQSPVPPAFPTTEEQAPTSGDAETPASGEAEELSGRGETEQANFSEEAQQEIEQWIAELGSTEFATRERAATRLTELGGPILARLRRLSQQCDDPEVRLRAGEIIKQLTRGDLNMRIDAFLAGEEVQFEGWRIAAAILGDSLRVRELFVEMLKAYPELTASLEGTARDRAMALEKVVAGVEHKIFVDREFPTSADAIALLFPASDTSVPLEGSYEDVLMAVLNKPAVTKLHRDIQLSGPFTALLSRWLPRSTMKNREEILFYGLSWDIRTTHLLALQTLSEAQQTETLALAFQAIARFGGKHDAVAIVKFLDDKRPAAERGFANGKRLRIELGDVAMATIARLHGVDLIEIGFSKNSVDEQFAFHLEDLGFPDGDESARDAARAKINQLLAPPVPPEEL